MMTRTRCPECRASISLADAGPGDPATCPECLAAFTVPAAPKRVVAEATADEPAPRPKKPKAGKKKARAAEPAGGVPKKALIAAAAGLGVVAVLAAIFLIPWGGKKGGGGADGGAAAAGGADAPTPGGFAVVDNLPGAAAPAAGAVSATAEPRKSVAVTPLVDDAPPGPVDGWALRPDPPPAPPEPLGADWSATSHPNSRPPVFAALNGPFVVVDDPPPESAKPGELPVGRATVYDLRTGKPAGFFRTGQRQIPFWGTSRLSPDGKWVVTEAVDGDVRRTRTDGVLYVYKQGEQTKPSAELKLAGPVAWLDFVSADRVAAYTFDPKPVVCVYTMADGKLVQSIPLTSQMHPAPVPPPNERASGRDPKFWYEPSDTGGAVSPGGKYLVLGGKTSLAVVSLAEGKQVGEVPVGEIVEWGLHLGIGFNPEGTELYAGATVRTPNAATRRLRGWSMATGQSLFDVPLGGPYISGSMAAIGPPLPGPDPGTLILPHSREVVDTRAGVVHYRLAFTPVLWAGPDAVVGHSGAVADRRGGGRAYTGFAQKFDRADYEKKAGPTLTSMAARPPVARGNRSGLAPTKPQPPAAWTAPPDNTPPSVPATPTLLPAWPTATSAGHVAIITFDYQQLPRSQYPVSWHRRDLASGKEEGPPVRLWPWAEMTERHVTMIEKFPAPPTAVTADGKRLAMRDPADPHRIDVWDDDGKRLGGFVPYDRKTPVEWVGWSGGRLLTLGGGRLTGWDGPTGKAVFEVEGGYGLPVVMPPSGAWVAALAGDAIDIFDPASGKCLARCVAPPGAAYLALAVSPDGKALAAARPGDAPVERPSPKPVDKRPVPLLGPAMFAADIWDLTTGRLETVPFGGGKFGFIHWTDPDHLFTSCGGVELIDRRAGAVVSLFYYPPRGAPAEGTQILAGTPDGRVWSSIVAPDWKPGESERRVWRPQALPDPKDDVDKLFLAADREYLRPQAGPIRVEVDLGTEDRSRSAAERVAAELRKRGYAIGPKGWAMRISHAVVDGQQRLQTGPSDQGRPVPEVRFTWRLFAPDGGVLWEGTSTGRFAGMGSQYYTKTKTEGIPGPNTSFRTDYYDFRGKDMRTAIAGEILERAADGVPEPPGGPPTAVIRAAGGSRPLPLARTMVLATGP
jgi:hypothetical protein